MVLGMGLSGCAAAPPSYDGLWRVQAYEVDGAVTPVAPRGDQPPFGGQDALLFIDGERISLQAPCNQVGIGSAVLEGDRLRVTGLGRTEMGCSGAGVMELEDHLVAVIGAGPQLTVAGDELTLSTPDAGRLTLIRVEPDPARPLVTSSAVEPPAEEIDRAGSSVPPTPLPPIGPDVPTPGWEPPAVTDRPRTTPG